MILILFFIEEEETMKRIILLCIILYLVIINIITFAVFGADKKKAIRGKWRVTEATLFLLAFIGGALGGCLGKRVFHHKTKKWYFAVGIPLILVLHLTLIIVSGVHFI